jgi:GT2 family glycosyltransferase
VLRELEARARRRARAWRSSGKEKRQHQDLIRESGLYDPEWIGAQLGTTFSTDEEAIEAYLAAPHACSPHPLIELDWIDSARPWRHEGVSGLVWYLSDKRRRNQDSPHPLIDLTEVVRQLPRSPWRPYGVLAYWLEVSGPDAPLPTVPGTPPVTLTELRAIALASLTAHRGESRLARVRRSTPTRPAYDDTLPPLDPPGEEPLVSIVLPTWNSSGNLRQAVESVQAQTFAGWELIVVDDGSEDDTPHVLEGLSTFEDRVVPVALTHGGTGRAHNEGIARARGEYVAFLDSNSTWEPDFLRVMLQNLVAHEWEMAHAVVATVRDGETRYRSHRGTVTDLLVRGRTDLSVLVVRRDLLSAVGGFDVSLPRGDDLDLELRLAARTEPHRVPYVGAVQVEDDEHLAASSPSGLREPDSWMSVAAGRHLLDWEKAASTPRVAGRTSVVLTSRGSLARTVSMVRELSQHPDRDLELVVVLAANSRRSHRVIADVLATVHGRTKVLYVSAQATLSLLADLGAVQSTGDRLVLVRPGAVIDAADLVVLADALDTPGVAIAQPLLVDDAEVVVSAGAVFGDRTRPQPFLAGHSVSDVAGHATVVVPAPFSPVVATTWEAFAGLRGLDPLFADTMSETDLALRLHQAGGGRTAVVPAARATNARRDLTASRGYVATVRILERRWPTPPAGSEQAWGAVGFTVAGYRNQSMLREGQPKQRFAPLDDVTYSPQAIVVPARSRAERITESPPALRWAIDLASPAGPRGEGWGDTHFGRSLAAALARQGQHVSLDSRQARHRWSRDLDDVLLVLRGLDRVRPRSGMLNVQWVISHPDLVTAEEAADFDLHYAASTSWAERMSERWRRPIEPLLQCTDPALFHPGRGVPDTGPAALFVGNSRRIYRTSVRSALAAGADVTIYGAGWQEFVSEERITADYVDNTTVGALYASSTVVLNDHWEDMRRDGVLSNRLFDAAACGARIVSDDCHGITEIFGDQVQVYRRDDEIGALLADPVASFPDTETRRKLAQSVIEQHSFDRRAQTLVADAAHALRVRG